MSASSCAQCELKQRNGKPHRNQHVTRCLETRLRRWIMTECARRRPTAARKAVCGTHQFSPFRCFIYCSGKLGVHSSIALLILPRAQPQANDEKYFPLAGPSLTLHFNVLFFFPFNAPRGVRSFIAASWDCESSYGFLFNYFPRCTD